MTLPIVLEQAAFYLFSLLSVAGAIGTVASKSAIRAAVSLLVTILGIAGLYATLSAQLLAAIQVMVYAGAVVVLFVFVVMLLGGKTEESHRAKTLRTRGIATGIFAVGALALLGLFAWAHAGEPHMFQAANTDFGSVNALGKTMFTDGLIAFELTGLLLTAAIVGVMAVARTRTSSAPTNDKEVSP